MLKMLKIWQNKAKTIMVHFFSKKFLKKSESCFFQQEKKTSLFTHSIFNSTFFCSRTFWISRKFQIVQKGFCVFLFFFCRHLKEWKHILIKMEKLDYLDQIWIWKEWIIHAKHLLFLYVKTNLWILFQKFQRIFQEFSRIFHLEFRFNNLENSRIFQNFRI